MMRTAKKGLLLLLGVAFMTTGCTASMKSYPYGMMDTTTRLKRLQRKDYEVLGAVEGTAHYSRFLCFGGVDSGDKRFMASFTPPKGGGIGHALAKGYVQIVTAGLVNVDNLAGGNRKPMTDDELDEMLPSAPLDPAEQAAAYDALEKQPDADGLINVIITKGERTHIPFLFTDETVTLKATAIKIKAG